MPPSFNFPDGKRFAFTIVDDTDVATVENVEPVYTLLHDLGMRTTKTVWPLAHDDPDSNYFESQTLADSDYLHFVRRLQQKGFEITWHSPTMESSTRPQILEGLQRFRDLIGHFPRIHVSHAENRENPYWGIERVDLPWIRWILRKGVLPADHYQGHVEGSDYWWGDQCERHIHYARNLSFGTMNLATINPTTPYHDPRRPLVRRWFSSSDAEDAEAFRSLIRRSNQDRLERDGGFCIVATHFGKGFTVDGRVDPGVRLALEELAGRSGWFPTVGELLDWLLEQHGSDTLPEAEWRRMQIRFLLDGMLRRLARIVGRYRN